MNKFFAFLFFGIITISCSKSNLEFENEYETSLRRWEAFKEKSNNSYKYTTYSVSWTGWNTEITITVDQGTIMQVDFIVPQLEQVKRPAEGWSSKIFSEALRKMGYTEEEIEQHEANRTFQTIEWTEDITTLGTHGDYYLRTIDDIYRKAKEEWLVKRAGITNYFESENEGIISRVGSYKEGCMDDCFNGVRIKSIDRK
ncbi:hypothetical protein [Sphingobacterium suaedae]|uniref:Uncharacterized protein n=1 Tax=Sphingobacterium suaedae TaxID=1686402 RepID=A0ABW5KIV5_9SPHI